LTGGVDEDYGGTGSSQVPTDGPDEEPSSPRQSRPFRGWGAAHEQVEAPSIWKRFLGWLRTVFSRKNEEDATEPTVMDEFPVTREQAVLVGEHVSVDELPPPSSDGDPLWDTPVVAEPSSPAPPSLEASDFSEVWNQRKSPLDGIDWKSLEEQPKEPGFFARLFSRKKKEEIVFAEEESFGDLASAEPADADFAPPPSDDDFAEEAPLSPPLLEHSAADSASLASLLDSTAPVEENHVEAPIEEPDLGDTVPVPMPAVPRPTPEPVAKAQEFQPTQPFPAFRDARDDFADEDAKADARAPEQVPTPVVDQDEKTDEFDLVPMPVAMGSTAETRMVPGFFGRMFGKKAEAHAPTATGIAATSLADDKIPFVLAKFRSFYNEVIRDKHQKSDVISGFATAVMGAGGATSDSDPEFAAQLLSKRLSEMLELQAAESNWTGGDAAKYYPEAQYAMVALADETFATIDWPGRSAWHKYMLEPRMYGTRGADIEFFKRIDKLLKESPDEKGARDLARLYLMVIASGYRGKFRVPKVRRPLAEYRRRLYEYSHQTDPLELYARERKVFPQAVAHTLVSRSVGRFTPAQKWVAVVLVLAVLYIGVSHYAWTSVSADLRDVMSRIQSSISQQPAGSTQTSR
jgi:type IV/VI secretion system ImpK/VasF family protein